MACLCCVAGVACLCCGLLVFEWAVSAGSWLDGSGQAGPRGLAPRVCVCVKGRRRMRWPGVGGRAALLFVLVRVACGLPHGIFFTLDALFFRLLSRVSWGGQGKGRRTNQTSLFISSAATPAFSSLLM